MVKRLQSTRKNIMREFTISELSAVDRPAQAHARVSIMKRAEDPPESALVALIKSYGANPVPAPLAVAQEIQALDFEAVMAEDKAREAAQRVKDCVWSKWHALQRSFETIAGDDDVAPAEKVTAMKESLQQFLQALADEADEIAESVTKSITTAVPAIAELLKQNGANQGDDAMTESEKKQLDELQKSVESLTKKLEAATAKEPAKKAADLQGELDAAKAQVEALTKKLGDAKELVGKAKEEHEEAVAKAAMSDAEKAHMGTLEGADKMKFMQATPEERKKMMAKRADADPVVYKSESSGEEFRKSDDPRLVKLAKQADEDRKIAKEEREKRETAELTKRADDFLKSFAGEVSAKVDVLRAISKMDAGPRAALEKMLEAGGKAIAAAFQTIGHSKEALQKSAADFNKRVDAIQAREKCARHEAMSKARAEDPDAYQAYQDANSGAGTN